MPIPSTEAEAVEPRRSESAPRKWVSRVEKRYKDLCRDWIDEAKKVEKIYEAKDPLKYPFNILYSNTQTLLPALYNSTPRPEVSRRHTQVDQQQKSTDAAVSQVVERFLEYSADSNNEEYEDYSEATRYAVEACLVPGLGTVRARLHDDGQYQQVCYESVQFDRFVWEKCRTWARCGWVAFGHDLGRADFEADYKEFARSKAYKDFEWDKLEKDVGDEEKPEKPTSSTPAVLVWEVWDWATRTVRHVCNQWPDEILLEEPYPELLTSRFPCPKPLMFAKKMREFCPIPAYKMYEQQAEELNRITGRIIRIIRALRARGIYNSSNPELQNLFEADDDAILVPSESTAAFQDGIDKSIWFMPLDQLVNALNQLYVAQQNCLQTIYQIMGISDIQRGATDPNETAKAQEIKNNWGGLRVKMSQKTVQDFCRDLFRIGTELAATYFTPATWAACTKVPLLFQAQKQQLMFAMQQYQQVAQQAQAMQQQPPPPPVSPAQQAMLGRPTWEEVIGVIKDSFERTYRIDVETNSTVDLEATEDKQAIAEFMNAFGQMTAGLEKMIANGSLPFEAAKVMLMEVTRRFRFGRQVEAVLEQMQQPQQAQEGDAKAVKDQAAAEIERVRAESAKKLAESEQTFTEMTGEIERLRTENTKLKATQDLAQKEQGLQVKEIGLAQREEVGKMKSDYQGKLVQQGKQGALKEVQMAQEKASMGLNEQFQQLLQQIQQSMAQFDQKVQAAAAQDGVNKKEEQMLARMEQQQAAFMQAMQEMVKAVSAPRAISAKKDKATGTWSVQSGTMQ